MVSSFSITRRPLVARVWSKAGSPPAALQIAPMVELVMFFVLTANHPSPGYLALIPKTQLHLLNLLPEEAVGVGVFSGLYRPFTRLADVAGT
ncbi:MAG: hypothetical protein IPO99_16075 [Nitrospira sp.]|nr:hypothetical protein [Nitrospira sp.]